MIKKMAAFIVLAFLAVPFASLRRVLASPAEVRREPKCYRYC